MGGASGTELSFNHRAQSFHGRRVRVNQPTVARPRQFQLFPDSVTLVQIV